MNDPSEFTGCPMDSWQGSQYTPHGYAYHHRATERPGLVWLLKLADEQGRSRCTSERVSPLSEFRQINPALPNFK
jgi:hypothetical protein